ncbi:MAG: right-handed parallel beta-helix repeat-containing protein [Prolixibacteraceae bacterium]|nr:right-handed parallel beta-helix repeat-containing protein [Prolixibacteraceae bacterium]
MKRIPLITMMLMGIACSLNAKSYQVAPWGNDHNPGNELAPWKTIQKGCDEVLAGDTLIIREGAYRIEREIRPKNSGTPDQWITYQVLPGEKAVIDAENFIAADAEGTYPSRKGLGSFHIEKVSYIRVEGLHVRNSRSAGFIVRGPSDHVELIHCKTDRSYNSGIGIWYADQVKVLHCEVTRANEPEMRVPGQTMGREAPHEAISICGAKHFEVAYNHVHQGFKEGIDVKEVSALGVVHHNYVHDMPRQGLYVDAWFGLLHEVTFHSNIVHDCEWGFAISVEGKDSELKNLAFHHNILYNNRASGIIFGVWGHDRPRSGIEIYNNTLYNNGSPGHWAGSTGGIDMRSHQSTEVSIFRNIIVNNWAYEIGLAFEPEKVNDELKKRNINIEDNITGPFKDKKSDWSFFERISAGYLPGNNIEADPLFTAPSKGDFSIPFQSPAAGNAALLKATGEEFYYGALRPGERSWLEMR